MTPKQLRRWQVVSILGGLFLGLWAATQYLASLLQYHSLLGDPLFTLAETPIYAPWSWLQWAYLYAEDLPEPFSDSMLAFGAGVGIGAIGAGVLKRRFGHKEGPTSHGSSRWAYPHELEALELAQTPGESRGIILGREPGGKRFLTHRGKEHAFVFAPTRSGKGVGLVIPTLLTWRGSVFVLDIKGENWALTSGWRSRFSHAVYFDPTNLKSARFNPLLEVRKGAHEVRDVRNIVDILGNPDGETKNDFWNLSAKNFLVGAILHVLYAEPDKSLAGVLAFLRDPRWTHEERLQRMLATPHIDGRAHPSVARAAKSLLNAPENTRGGILSTVESYLGLFDDPILAQVTSGESEFRLRDLQYAAHPVSLYLVVPPSDLLRVRPLLRLMLIQLGGALTEELVVSESKHRLLLLLDEFPTLGRMDWFEAALAYIAGYDIRAFLIAQDLNQIEKAYGANNAILGNCHIRIAFAPNDERTAKRLSEMLGQTTATKKTENFSGKRSAFGLDNVSRGVQEYARDLMTPAEILQLSADKELLFIAGQPPILADKIRYYEEPHFQQRCPGLSPNSPKPWAAQMRAPLLPDSGPYPDAPAQSTRHPWRDIIEPIEQPAEPADSTPLPAPEPSPPLPVQPAAVAPSDESHADHEETTDKEEAPFAVEDPFDDPFLAAPAEDSIEDPFDDPFLTTPSEDPVEDPFDDFH